MVTYGVTIVELLGFDGSCLSIVRQGGESANN